MRVAFDNFLSFVLLLTTHLMTRWGRRLNMTQSRTGVSHIIYISYGEDFWHDTWDWFRWQKLLSLLHKTNLCYCVLHLGTSFFVTTERGKWLLWRSLLTWECGLVFSPEVTNNNAATVIKRCEHLRAMDLNTINCPSVPKVQLPYQPHVSSSWDSFDIFLFREDHLFLRLSGPNKQLAWLIAAVDPVLQSKSGLELSWMIQ